MIEFEYKIRRMEGSRTKEFIPGIIKSPLQNVSVISAPNSSGKSTLMNLIALSLFGDNSENDAVNPSLRERIKSLLNHEIQEVTFSIKITDESSKNGLIITKEKFETNEMIRKELIEGKEQYISSEVFFKKYQLIYDIPDAPLKRLNNLIGVVRNQQNKWSGEIENLRMFLNSNTTELFRRQKQSNIKSLEEEIEKNNKEMNQISNDNKELKEDYSQLDKYYLIRKYKETESQYNSITSLYKELNSKQKQKKEQNEEISEQLYKKIVLNGQIIQKIGELKQKIIESTPEDDTKDIKDYNEWLAKRMQKATLNSVEKDLIIVRQLHEKVNENLSQIKESGKLDEIEFYKKLSLWIEENLNDISNVIVPGTQMDFQSFVEGIKRIVYSNKEAIEQKRRCENILEWIKDIEEEIKKYKELNEEISRDYKNLTTAQLDIKTEEFTREKTGASEEKRRLKRELDRITDEFKKYNIQNQNIDVEYAHLLRLFPQLNQFENKSAKSIQGNLKEINEKIGANDRKHAQKDGSLQLLKKQLNDAKNIKPHKYENKENELSKILELTIEMSKKVNDWSKLIESYDNKDSIEGQNLNTQNNLGYFSKVSKYLAEEMKSITHIGEKLELEEVDLLHSRFISKDGKIIHFEVMGTGESQLAYIISKLNYNDKKLVAMFDEVSTMTQETMRPIIDKMEELKRENKLLVGLLVFPSSEVKIRNGV